MEFKTSDTPQAAYLITQGYSPSSFDYSSPPRYAVVFDDSDAIRDLAFQYSAGLANVEPVAFNRILKKLNRIIRNQGQWGDD